MDKNLDNEQIFYSISKQPLPPGMPEFVNTREKLQDFLLEFNWVYNKYESQAEYYIYTGKPAYSIPGAKTISHLEVVSQLTFKAKMDLL